MIPAECIGACKKLAQYDIFTENVVCHADVVMPIIMVFNMTEMVEAISLYLSVCFEANQKSVLDRVSTELMQCFVITPKHAVEVSRQHLKCNKDT